MSTIHYQIREADSGDSLGVYSVDEEAPDERIIEALVNFGYLDPPADLYMIDDGYPFSEVGERVIVDDENEPVLTLDSNPPESPLDPGPDDEDDDSDEDDELDGEEVL